MKNFVIHIFLAAMLQGCSGPILEDKIRDGVTRDLLDPKSAQFREIVDYGDELICGEVNAMNKFGAYSGFQGIVWDKGQETLESEKDWGLNKGLCASYTDRVKSVQNHLDKVERRKRGEIV